METIDLTTEIEAAQPKPKAKPRAKPKAPPPDETLPSPEPKPKAKVKAKAKAKAKAADEAVIVADEPVVIADEQPAPSEPTVVADVPAPSEPIVVADEPAPSEPPIQPPVEEPSVAEAATTTRKPKGHRLKNPNKVPLTKKVSCKKCDKPVSLHNAKYTHDKFCKSKSETEPTDYITSKPLRLTLNANSSSSSQPLTLRDKLNAKRVESAKK